MTIIQKPTSYMLDTSFQSCTCNHMAPPERILRTTNFNRALATFYRELNLPGEATIDWVLAEIFDYRSGLLIGLNHRPIPVDSDDFADAAQFDDLFGEDERRFIARYKRRASGSFRYRLQQRCLFPVMILHFARQIYFCRVSGECAAT